MLKLYNQEEALKNLTEKMFKKPLVIDLAFFPEETLEEKIFELKELGWSDNKIEQFAGLVCQSAKTLKESVEKILQKEPGMPTSDILLRFAPLQRKRVEELVEELRPEIIAAQRDF